MKIFSKNLYWLFKEDLPSTQPWRRSENGCRCVCNTPPTLFKVPTFSVDVKDSKQKQQSFRVRYSVMVCSIIAPFTKR